MKEKLLDECFNFVRDEKFEEHEKDKEESPQGGVYGNWCYITLVAFRIPY